MLKIVWESGPWLPRGLSPEYLPLYWVGVLLLAAWCAQGHRPELSRLLSRVVMWLALLQSIVIASATGWALWRPFPGLSVNDVYVVAAATTSVSLVVAGLWLVAAIVRSPDLMLPHPSAQPPKWLVLVALVVGCVGTFGFGVVVLLFAGLLLHPEDSTAVMALGFGLMAMAAACAIIFGQKAAPRRPMLRYGPALLGALGLLVHVSLVLPHRPVRGMTDAVLLINFDQGVTEGNVSRAAMEELRRRPSGRFSTLAASLHPTRWQPGLLTARAQEQRVKAGGYAGCSMPISLESQPYEGKPELDLLGVLVARGELDVPRAWERDPRIDEDLRHGLQALFAKRLGPK